MKKIAVFITFLLLAITSYSQENINIQFDIAEQYSLSIGEEIDLINPRSTHKMSLKFDGKFLKIDYLSGKNFLMEKVEKWTVGYKYDKYSNKLKNKYYLLDILYEGKHLYYKIEFSQLDSSVLKKIYIPYMVDGMIFSYTLLQSNFCFGEKISN